MSTLRPPEPVKLVIGLFTPHRGLFDAVAAPLADAFGRPDVISPWMPFDQTDYYAAEMGAPLFRRMLAFERTADPGRLPEVKQLCAAIEAAHAGGARRRVNIDPGYLCRSRFVLATGKDFAHRIYIGDGVYADLTLVVQSGLFSPLPWTYPDYRQPDMLRFLDRVRSKYIADATERGGPPDERKTA